MNLEHIGATALFIVIGYLIGSFSWAVIISKVFMKEDVRIHGSGNAGATNALRNYGKKIAGLVFLLDMSKTVVAVVIAWSIKTTLGSTRDGMIIELAGLGAVVGHVYPLFFKFKGGKGSASLVGLFIVANWLLFFIGLFTFFAIALKTRKVSLGSLIAPLLLIFIYVAFTFIPGMNSSWDSPLTYNHDSWITILCLTGGWLITVFTHRGNIQRLLNGTERTLDDKKNKE